jgi:hypothetical protein
VALPAGSSPAAAAGDGEEDAAAAPAHDGGGDEVYFYNLATRAIRWTMPDAALGAAAAHAGDAGQPAAVMDRAAQQALVELQQERVMPSRAALQAGGWVRACVHACVRACVAATQRSAHCPPRARLHCAVLWGRVVLLPLARSWALGPAPCHHRPWGLRRRG